MKTIAYIANPNSVHDLKWINFFAKSYNVIIICADEVYQKENLDSNIKVYTILPPFPFLNVFRRFITIYKLKKIISHEKVDLIHTMYAFPNAIWVNYINFPYHIITTRGSDLLVDYNNLLKKSDNILENIKKKYFRVQLKISFLKSKFITSTSISQQQVLDTIVSQKNKLKLIRTGIDVDFIVNEGKNVTRLHRDLIFFSPRSMKPIYNIDIIVRAFVLFNIKHTSSRLVLVDDNIDSDYSKQIKNLILESKNTNILVLNKLSLSGMIEWYTRADLVISIPKSDGTPNSVLEAMALRKKIIIGAYEYDQDIFKFITKLNNNNVEELLGKMELLINKSDKDLFIDENFHLVNKMANIKYSLIEVEKLYMSTLNGIPTL